MHDPKISALTYLAPILWLLGFPEQARRSSAAAFRYAEEMNQVNLTVHVHVFAGAGLHELLRDRARSARMPPRSSTSRGGMGCATGC